MASSSTGGGHYLFLVVLSALLSAAYGQLSEQYYSTMCQLQLNKIVYDEATSSLDGTDERRRMGASLLRLFFHDCFVQGCDASVLLDDDLTKGIVSEKNAGPNLMSLRGFDVIDRIKDKVDKVPQCNGGVSCADILALAARQSVIILGGPVLPFRLGRRDSTTANKAEAETDLPSPSSNLTELKAAFRKKGFTPSELVTLSGGHTIGLARCTNVDDSQTLRCTSATNPNVGFLPLDKKSEEIFDNLYYKNLATDGLLQSDRVLVQDPGLNGLVGQYANNGKLFFQDFADAMKKMSEITVLTGSNKGEIRRDCHKVNS